jgi:hypothetical protein
MFRSLEMPTGKNLFPVKALAPRMIPTQSNGDLQRRYPTIFVASQINKYIQKNSTKICPSAHIFLSPLLSYVAEISASWQHLFCVCRQFRDHFYEIFLSPVVKACWWRETMRGDPGDIKTCSIKQHSTVWYVAHLTYFSHSVGLDSQTLTWNS